MTFGATLERCPHTGVEWAAAVQSRLWRFQHLTDSANRMDKDWRKPSANFLPYSADVYIHKIGAGIIRRTKNLFFNHFTTQSASNVLCQIFEARKLSWH
jgi:hypothetical protein